MENPVSFYFPSDLNEKPLYLENPIEHIIAFDPNEVEDALKRVDEWARKKKYYIAGYISYEAGYSLLGIENKKGVFTALVDFYVFEKPSDVSTALGKPCGFYEFYSSETIERYEDAFSAIQKELIAGNTYQVNYTYLNTCRSFGDSRDLFEKLFLVQPSKYAVFAQLKSMDVLSVSPELFFSKRGAKIISKPMKGTLPLGVKEVEESTQEKLNAENMMIVDLIRNDLSRLAKPETVHVSKLMEYEQYPTLQQIVSTVEAELEESAPFSQIIQFLFPCGSITGAPKRRTMEIIQALERDARGIYTGTLGYISPENDMQFNVAIRTLFGRGVWCYGVGGGLVLDSHVDEEWEESQLKRQFIKSSNHDFYLFETLLIEKRIICDLEPHLYRLSHSAQFFGFMWSEDALRKALEIDIPTDDKYRLRIVLKNTGDVETHLERIYQSTAPKTVVWSTRGTDSKSPVFRHKTSIRGLYEEEYKRVQEDGHYDVLFMNEKQEVTEASRHNIFVQIEGEWMTPPLTSGLLNGIERQKQIELLNAKEKIVSMTDVSAAQKILLTNSVRGCVEVTVKI